MSDLEDRVAALVHARTETIRAALPDHVDLTPTLPSADPRLDPPRRWALVAAAIVVVATLTGAIAFGITHRGSSRTRVIPAASTTTTVSIPDHPTEADFRAAVARAAACLHAAGYPGPVTADVADLTYTYPNSANGDQAAASACGDEVAAIARRIEANRGDSTEDLDGRHAAESAQLADVDAALVTAIETALPGHRVVGAQTAGTSPTLILNDGSLRLEVTVFRGVAPETMVTEQEADGPDRRLPTPTGRAWFGMTNDDDRSIYFLSVPTSGTGIGVHVGSLAPTGAVARSTDDLVALATQVTEDPAVVAYATS
jgi:hypothetical protein